MFHVSIASGVAGQLMIESLTIDDLSVPRRQAQQSSIVNSAIVNFPDMVVRAAGAVV
jgi:hypothetical protein